MVFLLCASCNFCYIKLDSILLNVRYLDYKIFIEYCIFIIKLSAWFCCCCCQSHQYFILVPKLISLILSLNSIFLLPLIIFLVKLSVEKCHLLCMTKLFGIIFYLGIEYQPESVFPSASYYSIFLWHFLISSQII